MMSFSQLFPDNVSRSFFVIGTSPVHVRMSFCWIETSVSFAVSVYSKDISNKSFITRCTAALVKKEKSITLYLLGNLGL